MYTSRKLTDHLHKIYLLANLYKVYSFEKNRLQNGSSSYTEAIFSGEYWCELNFKLWLHGWV